ncbi:MFS transporter, FHS family, L-fucose permease [Ruaniaceae bacterium KH17]|nr:MFS transporter, FHS family, L-fucose permease [Ruaniaceae bacterium KH17]
METNGKVPLVAPGMKAPFILLLLCFAAWGAAANLTDVLVSVFRSIFTMSNLQSTLVQSAYYGAYFLLAIPAALINAKFGYKAGVLTGLGLAAVGGILFLPASNMLQYGAFLAALFVLAAGLSILETSANPFMLAMGEESTATRRLNLAQAFNPIGANIGVLMGAVLILPRLTPEASKVIMTEEELLASQHQDLYHVMVPYLGIAAVLLIIWVLIALTKIPRPAAPEESVAVAVETSASSSGGVFGRLWRNRRYRYGVIAQFFNVGGQTCVWTFTVIYAMDVVGFSKEAAGWWLQASLLVFLVSRFVMTALLTIFRPTKLLLVMATFGVACAVTAMFSLNVVGLIAVVAISAGLSLMFPTIYGVALEGMGEDAKFGAAGLVMAILGGAIVPLLHASVMDMASTAIGYVVPAVCMAIVALYALYDLKAPASEDYLALKEGAQ